LAGAADIDQDQVSADFDQWNIRPTEGELLGSLRLNGADPVFITKVVLTHAHPDHLWGISNSVGELNYPNATYHVGGAEWNFWMNSDVATSLPATEKLCPGLSGRSRRSRAG
jgi:glyoxylase-like metal-dependent hydrolase (beta-lactamase superfamily II)